MVSRKKAAGKARKAAKAKAAREEAEEGENNNQMANNVQQSPSRSVESRYRNEPNPYTGCIHGFGLRSSTDICFQFVTAFKKSFCEAIIGGVCASLGECLEEAQNATLTEFADVWRDFAKMEIAMSIFLCMGTQVILDGPDCYDRARRITTCARYFEQYIAVVLKQSQALYNWVKVYETYLADLHTLVKFFRRRNPCSCLDEKYQEVKYISKMGGCYNPQCRIPNRNVERSKTKYCSRCRSVTYCSRECQEADWTNHRPLCDKSAAVIAKFEAKQQN